MNTTLSPDNYMPGSFYEIDTPFIAAHQWPAALIDLALGRGQEEHKLLRGTGIFYADILSGNLTVSPQQCFQLIENARKHHNANELAFLLGHRLFPGNYAAAGNALVNATNLQDALDSLTSYKILLVPLLNPRIIYEQERLVIYWQGTGANEATQLFLLEMMATALGALSRWLGGEALPWQFYFTCTQPAHTEQYEVHLDGEVHFNAAANAMAIAREHLHRPWKNTSPSARVIAQRAAEQQLAELQLQQGFLAETYTYLHNNIHSNPNLEKTAEDFGMSSASFKRKLKKHNSHFQEQYDSVRKDLAIYWLSHEGWTNEQVAQKLHFYDAANLRRAFKKWTGALPSKINKHC
ncbi:MAG: AraC family transcriptional regulator ligand-binding domain-containing protein [Cellvibrio sp.]|uniref:AraC family transcriptional regulator ligand-binding domain-containing protein n=1 Tax=Cellvibrio sp. TaxID=1965322 RepID=UPI0031A04EF3